jgi:putative hydrolase of the HAD superfamily
VLEAVLFDWGDTLARWEWSDELHDAGHAAGFAAIGREASPESTRRFRAELLPLVEERDYRELMREWLAPVADEELDRFLAAEYAAWQPGHHLAPTTPVLLETLRDRGLKTGLVSNGFDPPDLVRAELSRLGVAQLLDVIVMSGDVGVRKPDPAIFRYALEPGTVVRGRCRRGAGARLPCVQPDGCLDRCFPCLISGKKSSLAQFRHADSQSNR